MIRPPPRSTLFPSTTLFRSGDAWIPTRPITLIVVFAPGGATDVLARIVGDHMMRTLGQRVVVENVSGAGGTIGDRKSTRLNSSHANISYAVFCLKKKKN